MNSDVIYAACMGLPFERTPERGLYKSTDYGQTWDTNSLSRVNRPVSLILLWIRLTLRNALCICLG